MGTTICFEADPLLADAAQTSCLEHGTTVEELCAELVQNVATTGRLPFGFGDDEGTPAPADPKGGHGAVSLDLLKDIEAHGPDGECWAVYSFEGNRAVFDRYVACEGDAASRPFAGGVLADGERAALTTLKGALEIFLHQSGPSA